MAIRVARQDEPTGREAWGPMTVHVAGTVTVPGRAAGQATSVERLARWLLVVVVLDLLVTRVIVRLAMFIPRDEPWAAPASVLGRLGAATDVLVPIVGVLLLGALLVGAARDGGIVERVTVAAVGLVAVGGFALLVLPPTPDLVLAIDLVVGLAAGGAAIGMRGRDVGSPLVRPGLVVLATALVLVAVGRALGALEAIGSPVAPGSAAAAGTLMGASAQIAFVTGGGLVGIGGILAGRGSRTMTRRGLAMATVVGLAAAAAWTRAPASWDALTIWSVGLGGAIPALLVALVLGLLVAGLPSLHRQAPMVAVGVSIALAAGVGLAASGLVLAGLLGLVVAGSRDDGRCVAVDVPARHER